MFLNRRKVTKSLSRSSRTDIPNRMLRVGVRKSNLHQQGKAVAKLLFKESKNSALLMKEVLWMGISAKRS